MSVASPNHPHTTTRGANQTDCNPLMTHDTTEIGQYFQRLSTDDRASLDRRKERYRDQLEAQGLEVAVASGDGGFFAGVLVVDPDDKRFGFLEEDGSVSWIGEADGFGALGSAVVQSHGPRLEQIGDELEGADVE